MAKWFLKNISWLIVLALAITIKLISFNHAWVEQYYSNGIYPFVATLQRYLLGWLPFSLGDVFYLLVIIYCLLKLYRLIIRFKKRAFSFSYFKVILKKAVFVALIIYVVFYGLWGLNYSRIGIAGQLGLQEQQYSAADLDTLVSQLHNKLNANAALLTPQIRDSFKTKKNLFKNAARLYKIAEKKYPFLKYNDYSVKPSLFSYLGNYLGFQGYYNPFTGEAQVNTTIPKSEEPFVASHEIAHQLGYAKESEANFVGFLACRLHPSVNFQYSVYFDMYHYAIRELFYVDSIKAKKYDSTLHIQAKKDWEEYITFYKKYQNPIDPVIDQLYSYFLKANNQPNGKASYNEVVIWLVAYYKKYGKEAI